MYLCLVVNCVDATKIGELGRGSVTNGGDCSNFTNLGVKFYGVEKPNSELL